MITSIFKKSKPLNLIILTGFITVIFVVHNIGLIFSSFSNALQSVSKLIITLFLVFLLDFIVSKNQLRKKNNYAILTFCLLFGLFPNAFQNLNLLISNIFILFGLRRIMSLKSNVNIKKKLFDAGFWLTIASLLYFWAILFFLLLFMVTIKHAKKDIKNALIPCSGIATVLILLLCYNLFFYNTFYRASSYDMSTNFNYTAYNSVNFILKLTSLFTSLIWILVYYFKSTLVENIKHRPLFILILSTAIITVLIAVISPIKNGSEFLFLFAPFAIIMANYIEAVKERWIKDIFVSLFLILTIVSLVLQFSAESQIPSIA